MEPARRLALAERFVQEARALREKGDSIQASEKLYKAAEGCVKAMAEALGLEEATEARQRGRWTLRLLDNAAARLAEKTGRREIHDDWLHAYFLHVEGFHEARLGVEQVGRRSRYIEELLEIARRVAAGGPGSRG